MAEAEAPAAMNPREAILSRVRGALAPLGARAPLPETASQGSPASGDPKAEFARRLRLAGGELLSSPGEIPGRLAAGGWTRGYCDPSLWPALGPVFGRGFVVEREFDQGRLDDYEFGITRAAGAIAETGTIIINDALTSRRLAALAPWVHIAVLRRCDILATLPEAIAALGGDPNVIWCTGPSKTADVEGILIQGVHGPGVQIALVL